MTIRTATHTPKLAYRIAEASRLIGLSRSSLYRLVDSKELTLVKLSARSSAITRSSIVEYAQSRAIPLPDSF